MVKKTRTKSFMEGTRLASQDFFSFSASSFVSLFASGIVILEKYEY